jgi:hypothetical protein
VTGRRAAAVGALLGTAALAGLLARAPADHSLACPAGTARVEARPPAGPEAWCERDGRRDGPYRAWYPRGRLKIEGAFADGRKTGRWTYWHGNGLHRRLAGQKKEEGEYRDGREQGRWTRWHALGPKREEGGYVDGRREGRWTVWSEIGVKLAEGEYRDDHETGTWLRWSAKGEPCPPEGPAGA